MEEEQLCDILKVGEGRAHRRGMERRGGGEEVERAVWGRHAHPWGEGRSPPLCAREEWSVVSVTAV